MSVSVSVCVCACVCVCVCVCVSTIEGGWTELNTDFSWLNTECTGEMEEFFFSKKQAFDSALYYISYYETHQW